MYIEAGIGKSKMIAMYLPYIVTKLESERRIFRSMPSRTSPALSVSSFGLHSGCAVDHTLAQKK